MRLRKAALVLAGLVWLSSCASNLSIQAQPSTWSTGFWLWYPGDADTERFPAPVDVLFVHVGYIRGGESLPLFVRQSSGRPEWTAFGHLPDNLPPARECWLVWRYERQGVPDLQAAPAIAREFARLAAEGQDSGRKVAGVQLDIDSPTGMLPQYARFLQEVRKNLPEGFGVSITALLDWFRTDTAIEDVVQQVDEFVPQFYDVRDRDRWNGDITIAAPVDTERWGQHFRRFGKRYRIGISTFGRARMVRPADDSEQRSRGVAYFRDLVPLDVATNSAFQLRAGRNNAGELVLSYQASRRVEIGYSELGPGDAVEFILAAPESIRAAVDSARKMGGNIAGVVFFRWPNTKEVLTMQPVEALMAAGLIGGAESGSRVRSVDGQCAAVACVDLYLETALPLSPQAIRYLIRASTELEYFVPKKNVPIRLANPSLLEVTVPPYCGRGRFYLGRAVSRKHSEFSIQEER